MFWVAEAAAQQIFTVSFEVNGGTQVAEQQVSAGRTLSRPDAPARDGFMFDGWYADPALETPFDFDTPVASDMTLYAKWTEVLDGGRPSHWKTASAAIWRTGLR